MMQTSVESSSDAGFRDVSVSAVSFEDNAEGLSDFVPKNDSDPQKLLERITGHSPAVVDAALREAHDDTEQALRALLEQDAEKLAEVKQIPVEKAERRITVPYRRPSDMVYF
ncbi:MAG: hypothetical protein MHM6MM_004742 [Cercozoa sp. M6MM]